MSEKLRSHILLMNVKLPDSHAARMALTSAVAMGAGLNICLACGLPIPADTAFDGGLIERPYGLCIVAMHEACNPTEEQHEAFVAALDEAAMALAMMDARGASRH